MVPAVPAHDLAALHREFDIPGDFIGAAPYGSGHINDTYRVTCNQAGTPVRYIFQRLNPRIFPRPEAVMENILRVTSHIRQRLEDSGKTDISRRVLTLVPTRGGAPTAEDAGGATWRVYLLIENATGHDHAGSPAQAFEAARAFGRFQALLADLPGGRLHETLPGFHDTPLRYAALHDAVARDPQDRVRHVARELDFALAREQEAGRLTQALATGAIPERITHNDTKLNNVLLDNQTGEGLCVIDLDTTMPGCALHDFGDMVRSAASSAQEDTTDPESITCRTRIFEALVDGYLSEAGAVLTPAECAELVFSGKLLALECGVRFLTDYLLGDVYFKIHRPGHNLDRCRNQFALARSIEVQDAALQAIAREALARHRR